MKWRYSNRLNEVEDKGTVTVMDFQKQEERLTYEIKNLEMEIGLLELEKEDVASKVETNFKRRMCDYQAEEKAVYQSRQGDELQLRKMVAGPVQPIPPQGG